ncbi:DUF397 domain-containing protein [Streptomyces prunicolor]|uniref:DUF397 domain-containing protein n=1 Tax=Streptomyces prunicolor TaxID=67348 RepID=UPI0003A9247E|nr:DUF397 domain-containing protein [Streptomyces prunicolor]
MSHVLNAAVDLGVEGWECPWSGTNGGQCLEAMDLGDGRIALRQSTDPHGPALIFTKAELGAFVSGAKAGKADYLITPGLSVAG